MQIDEKALEDASRAYCEVIRLNYDGLPAQLAAARDEAMRAAILAYEAAKPATASEAVALRDRIADLIDETAEVRGEHPSDHAVLQNADEIADAILKLHPTPAIEPRPEAVAVKALEWREFDKHLIARAEPVGVYAVLCSEGFEARLSGEWLGRFGSYQAARTACQSDYEARIRSALATPAPAPAASGGLEAERQRCAAIVEDIIGDGEAIRFALHAIRNPQQATSVPAQMPVAEIWFGFDENTGEFTGEYSTVKPHDTRGMVPFVRAEAAALASPAATSTPAPAEKHFGPYGYLVIPNGLGEEHWRLEDNPEADPEYTSIALFAESDPFAGRPINAVAAKGDFTSRAYRIICEAAGSNQADWSSYDHGLLDLAREADAALAATASAKVEPEGR